MNKRNRQKKKNEYKRNDANFKNLSFIIYKT